MRGIVEKPQRAALKFLQSPNSNFYDGQVADIAATLKPSARVELEITDLANQYLVQGRLELDPLGRGFAWLDTGTRESLLQAAEFVATIEASPRAQDRCPEEVAWRHNWIDDAQLEVLAARLWATPSASIALLDPQQQRQRGVGSHSQRGVFRSIVDPQAAISRHLLQRRS